jgi:hypothetical protein
MALLKMFTSPVLIVSTLVASAAAVRRRDSPCRTAPAHALCFRRRTRRYCPKCTS